MVDAWIDDNGQPVLRRIPLSDPRAHQFLESYLPAFFAAGALCLIAAVLILTLGDRRERKRQGVAVARAAA